MFFSFLNPWVWLATLAVAAPVWLHLRRKRERRLIRFSAVRFLLDEPRAHRRPVRLRHPGLLLLRSLAVLLIVGAFAWPYVHRPGAAAIRQSVVYILDNTLSHQAGGGFTTDRDRLVRELPRAGPGLQVAVVELTSRPRVVAGFETDRSAAAQKVAQLRPSFERGSYLAAFRLANSLLDSAAGPTRRIVLRSDSQANQWRQEASTPPFLHDVQLELPRVSSPQQPNLWLAEPRARRLFLGGKSTVNFTLRLGHLGPARQAHVLLRANGQTLLDRTVDLANQPRNILLQADGEADPASWVRAEASVEGTPDALPADNHLFFSLPPVAEGSVALLAQSPYLRLALSPEVMRGQWSTRVLDPANLKPELAAGRAADVLCLESAFLQSPDGRALVKRYLEEGRGVFLIVNRLSPAIDGFLRELGFEPDQMVVSQGHPEHFQFVLSNHTIFHPFQSPEFGSLTEVEVLRHARLRPTAGRPLIFSQTGDGLFFEGTKPRGKLFVCAFGLDRAQSSWPVHPTFIPFLDLTLQAARARDAAPVAFQPGEVATVEGPAGRSTRAAVLRDGSREIERIPVQNGRAEVPLPGVPGLYTLTFDGGPEVARVFSVNPDPRESELEFAESPGVVQGWCLAPGSAPRPAAAANGPVGISSILQQRFWWWMVLGGLLALGLETAWAQAKGEAD